MFSSTTRWLRWAGGLIGGLGTPGRAGRSSCRRLSPDLPPAAFTSTSLPPPTASRRPVRATGRSCAPTSHWAARECCSACRCGPAAPLRGVRDCISVPHFGHTGHAAHPSALRIPLRSQACLCSVLHGRPFPAGPPGGPERRLPGQALRYRWVHGMHGVGCTHAFHPGALLFGLDGRCCRRRCAAPRSAHPRRLQASSHAASAAPHIPVLQVCRPR